MSITPGDDFHDQFVTWTRANYLQTSIYYPTREEPPVPTHTFTWENDPWYDPTPTRAEPRSAQDLIDQEPGGTRGLNHAQHLWACYSHFLTRETLMQVMAHRLADPAQIDQIKWCQRCETPNHEFTAVTIQGYETVCLRCYRSASACNDCGKVYLDNIGWYSDNLLCNGCRDDHWTKCEQCHYWWDLRNHSQCPSDSHPCDCAPPTLDLTIRSNGNGVLRNDERLTVSLGAGHISDQGMSYITEYLQSFHLYGSGLPTDSGQAEEVTHAHRIALYRTSLGLDSVGQQWQTKQGNFTKRLAQYAYKQEGYKLPPEVISRVGNIAREHSKGSDFTIEVTRRLNMPPEAFYHEGSCWWGGYAKSRCLLKTLGGFGIRSFEGDTVSGRAWAMPMRVIAHGALGPTFDAENADAIVVLNGYGDLSLFAAARILSHLYGMTYTRIGFSCEPMYVNGETAVLVAPPDIIENYKSDGLHLTVDDIHPALYSHEMRSAHDAA